MSTTQEKPVVVRRRPAQIPKLRLVYSGDEALVPPETFTVRSGATPIGRETTGGIRLERDSRASRLHATLHTSVLGTLRIVDEKSRNGTHVNGVRVDEALLQEGDVLSIGDSYFVVRSEPEDLADAPVPALLGTAPCMRSLRAAIHRVAPAQATVLLLAESGCGKEVVARAIHDLGRPGGPFVAVNCSAIPESLAESQLFGHLAGSFSGAVARPGLFRAAHGGTLFLDEAGELPPAIQPKLLRVLQDRIVVPVGATTGAPCDVRIVAATNRDLRTAVAERGFRGDLYARLSEFPLEIAPLRERREDVLLLLLHALGAPRARITSALAEALLLHDWPFNVREVLGIAAQLRIQAAGASTLDLVLVADRLARPGEPARPREAETIARTAGREPRVAASPDTTGEEEIEPEAGGSVGRAGSAPRRPMDLTEAQIREALREGQHEIGSAAKILGIPRPSLYRAMKQFSIRTASDLSVEEIEAAHRSACGDVVRMAASLEVSEKALLRRVRELHLVSR